MADTSDFSVEERVVATVWVNKRPHTGKTKENIVNDFFV